MRFSNKTLQGLKRRQFLLYILLFSLITIIVWAVFSLIHSQKKVPISAELLRLSQAISPSIDSDSIQEIEKRKKYSDAELGNFPVYVVSIDDRTKENVLITLEQASQKEADKLKAQEEIRLEKEQELLQELRQNFNNEASQSTSSFIFPR